VAIGAPGQDGNGAVYVFARGADGSWMMEGSALASRRSSDNAQFGSTVLLAGDRLMVGAPGANFVPQVAAQPEAAAQGGRRFGGGGVGMVVSFDRNANSGIWSEGGLLAPYDFPTTAAFGSALAMAGSELWVGAPRSGGSGDIYRVAMTAEGGVRAMAKLVVDSVGGRNAQFGGTLAVAGDRAVVGMPFDVGGQGTVLFLERIAGQGWTTVGTAFPPTKDRFQMVRGKEIICDNGEAAEFKCGNTGLLAFLPTSQVGGGRGSQMSDNWGWTDPQTGREYALAGRNDGTAFVDITDPENPTYLGNLPLTPGANAAAWRDIKTYKNHAYVVADGAGEHGMQVFDLTRLRGVRSPQIFTPDFLYTNITSSHNIVINEETGFAYSVGSSGRETCGGGLHMINIQEPKNPKFVGCAAYEGTGRRGTGYSHDAVCIVYKGPDTKYQGHEICVGSNETAIAVQDVTDKANPVSVSSASYPFVAYAHQGWFTDDHKYFYLDDESDEISAQRDTTGQNMAGKGTRTMVYDMTDLDDPVLVKEYIGTVRASDHNLYVKGNKLYLSNYGSGLRIADISDPTNPREVAYLDTYPDDEDQPQMVGAWSVYPFFKSGTIIVTSVSEGLFLVKDRSQAVP
jgi:choice-of-anchor B domain-containing protein